MVKQGNNQSLVMISSDHPSFAHGFFMRAIEFTHGLARIDIFIAISVG